MSIPIKLLKIVLLWSLFLYSACCGCDGVRPVDQTTIDKLTSLQTNVNQLYRGDLNQKPLDSHAVAHVKQEIDDVYKHIARVEGSSGVTALALKNFQDKFIQNSRLIETQKKLSQAETDQIKQNILNDMDHAIEAYRTADDDLVIKYSR